MRGGFHPAVFVRSASSDAQATKDLRFKRVRQIERYFLISNVGTSKYALNR